MLPVALLAAALALPSESDNTLLATAHRAREWSALEVWAERLRVEGTNHRLAGRPTDALPLFNAAVLLRPDDSNVVGGRATVLALLGRHDNAADDFARVVALAPNDWCTWASVGEGWIARGKYDEAEQCFERAFRLAPDRHRAVVRLWQAFAWLQAEELPLAVPISGTWYFRVGVHSSEPMSRRYVPPEQINRVSGAQQVRAENALNDALALAPERDSPLRGMILYSRGLLRMEMRRAEIAAADFEESITYQRANPYAYEKLADLAADRHAYPEALRWIDLAAGCGMSRVSELRKRGAWLMALGEYEKAERCAAEVCEIDPNNATVLRIHAVMLWHFGKDDSAEERMKEGAAAIGFTLTGEAFFEMLALCQHLNDSAAAERVARRVLERPDLTCVQRHLLHLTLGELYMRMSREEEAFEELTQAVRLVPDGPNARHLRAGLALRLKRFAVAMEDAEAIVRVDPQDPTMHAFWKQVRGPEELSAALANRPPDYRPAGPVVKVPITVTPMVKKMEYASREHKWRGPGPSSKELPVASASQR